MCDAACVFAATHMDIELDKIKIRSAAKYHAVRNEIEKVIKGAKRELNVVDY